MSKLLAGKILMKNNERQSSKVADPSKILENKVVLLYFSAHWCPPCRGFTPLLKEFFDKHHSKGIEIIFISWDNTEKEQHEYLKEAHGNWMFIQFGDLLITELNDKYKIEGIPTLVVIKSDGSIVVEDAVELIEKKELHKTLIGEWKALNK